MAEAPEFGSRVLDALRQPLEEGEVPLRRSGGETVYPARVQLVLAANPCPCARPAGDRQCTCSSQTRRRYFGRLSGPLLDRVDLHVTLHPVGAAALLADQGVAESSPVVAARVARARAAAAERWARAGCRSNAAVPAALLRRPPYRLPRAATRVVAEAVDKGTLSARGHDRVLKVAWTIADLDGRTAPDAGDVAEALELREGTAL